MKKILISGSIAYDHLMVYNGYFDDALLPQDFKSLSVSFLAQDHERFYGGCAANIAYGLSVFGLESCIFGEVGDDFGKYRDWLARNKIGLDYVSVNDLKPCSAAFILTDKDSSQITFFSPSVMGLTDFDEQISSVNWDEIEFVCISPDDPVRMMKLAKYCFENNIPYYFDPGQTIPALNREDLINAIENSNGVILNNYESDLLCKKSGVSFGKISKLTGFALRTIGERGCELIVDGTSMYTHAVEDVEAVDVTGSGDAFRAGFFKGVLSGEELEKCCIFGNVAASFAVEVKGTQTYRFIDADFQKRLWENY